MPSNAALGEALVFSESGHVSHRHALIDRPLVHFRVSKEGLLGCIDHAIARGRAVLVAGASGSTAHVGLRIIEEVRHGDL